MRFYRNWAGEVFVIWPDFVYRFWFVLTGNCLHHCHVDETYGFVPEVDCPVHDRRL